MHNRKCPLIVCYQAIIIYFGAAEMSVRGDIFQAQEVCLDSQT